MEAATSAAVVRATEASKRYGTSEAAVWALRGISLEVHPGEFIALMGRSGCGKTTLLNLLGAMDLPTFGTIKLAGCSTTALADDALTALRRRSVGFVFQAFHLLPTLTVGENVALPLLLGPPPPAAEIEALVADLAARVGIAHKLAAFPHQLSGGEAQRVAVARALIHRPGLILADEPTGNLDSHSAALVVDLLAALSREQGAAVVMATHSPESAARAHRIVRLRDGQIEDNSTCSSAP